MKLKQKKILIIIMLLIIVILFVIIFKDFLEKLFMPILKIVILDFRMQ